MTEGVPLKYDYIFVVKESMTLLVLEKKTSEPVR